MKLITRMFKMIIFWLWTLLLFLMPRIVISFFVNFVLYIFNFKPIHIVEKKTDSPKKLLWLNYQEAIGDFTILIRALIKLASETTDQYDVIAHIKFKGIIEKLGLKNFNLIYLNHKLSNNTIHYSESDGIVYQEIYNMHLEYDEIYYFSDDIFSDFLLGLCAIKYNRVITFKTSRQIEKKHYTVHNKNILLSLYLEKKFKSFNFTFKSCPNAKELHLCDIAYFHITNKLPNRTLTSLTLSEVFNLPITKNSVAMMLDENTRGKFLKTENLVHHLNTNYANRKIIFLGSGKSWIEKIKLVPHSFDIIDKLGTSGSVLNLYENIAKAESILAYDTCILHIATLMNKQIEFIYNKNKTLYKNKYNYWLGYKDYKKINIIALSSKQFSIRKEF